MMPLKISLSVFAVALMYIGALASAPAEAQGAKPAAPIEIVPTTGHASAISDLAISKDGRLMLSGAQDNKILLWDVASGRMLRTFTGHAESVMSIALSPDEKLLASGSLDKTVRIWDVARRLRGTDQGRPFGCRRGGGGAVR
jgi:WD40 repeat protein